MRLLATTIIALRALRRNKLRSALTALGIIIGVAGVIATVAIGNGAKVQVENQIASLGRNVVTVFPGSFSTGGARGGFGSASTLTIEDIDAIRRDVADIAAISPEVSDRNQVLANGLNWNTQVRGVGPEYLSVRAWDTETGTMFGDQDLRSAAKVCVIGTTIAKQLFPNSDPLGQTIRIRNIPFIVRGILVSKGFNFFGQDQDDTIIVPYTTHMRRLNRRTTVNTILIEAANPEVMPRIQQDTTDLLTQRRRGREPDFTVRNQLELAQTATATARVMTLLLGAIAGVSLFVGGIGIMNIMLVSVTERTREIGIRLAIGAHDRDIRVQFLIEAMVLSVLGGIAGVLLGTGLSQVLSKFTGWSVLVSTNAVLISVGISAFVGIVFGFYPAHKAAQLDPIEALRFE
ncbi:MAG: ABC transporter permease [Verrucomicrobia bacterium]|nr:ABC transporter permease [Verrucomicrobiota bacterium]